MKKIVLTEVFNNKPEQLWEILSDLSRSDWVPGVDQINLEGICSGPAEALEAEAL